jgi:hypothetical protein
MIKFSIPPALDQCRSAALAYAKMGWGVFPAPPSGEKKSLKSARRTKNGQAWGKTTDLDEIRSDYAKWKNANVGIATGAASKIWVLDLDKKEGVDGLKSLAALEQQYGSLPATLKAVSPSGSVHYYWLWPSGREVRNSTSGIAPGIDVRGEGGMVLAPPSVRPGKGAYAWTSIVAPVEAPDWLLDLAIRANDSSRERVSGESEASPELIAAALAVIPNDDLDWDNWNRIGMAAFRASGGQSLAAFDAWSKKSRKYWAPDVSERWANYSRSPPDQIGAGTLFFMANQADPTWLDAWHDWVVREIEEADAAYDRAYAEREERVVQDDQDDQDDLTDKGEQNDGQVNQKGSPDEGEQKSTGPNGPDEKTEQAKPEPPPKPKLITSIEDWIAREIEPPDFICGKWLTTTSRVLLTGDTGLGKTLLALAMAMRCAIGQPFLHWSAARLCRVLYVDGEMSRRVNKQRLIDEIRRMGESPVTMHLICHEDVPDGHWQPLNTAAGQKFIDDRIAQLGGFDLIIFDNVMALISGDQKDEEGWHQAMKWIRGLTRRRIGQIWIHHTGHDTTRGYGTKTREWQMDSVIHLDAVERAGTDVSFRLSFPKAREREPSTRTDFRDVEIALVNDQWTYSGAVGGVGQQRVSPWVKKFYDALCVATGKSGTHMNGAPSATYEQWRSECELSGLLTQGKKDSNRSLMSKARLALIAANWIACNGDLNWTLRPNPEVL